MIRAMMSLALSLCAAAAFAAGADVAARRFSLVTPEGKAEGRPALDFSDGPKIVIWSSPSDPAAKPALEALGRDAAARAALITRAIFLAPEKEAAALAAINEAGPYEYSVRYSAADWPEISGSVPRAYFYSDGGPVCEADLGAEDPAAGFRACMERSGLLSAEARLDTAVRLTWLNRGDDGEREEAKRLVSAEASALLAAGGFSAGSAAGLSAGALRDAYRIAAHYNFYGPEKEMISAQEGLLEELEKRGLATSEMVEDMHEALLRIRMFAEAGSFRLSHPSTALQEVPEIKGKAPRKKHERPVYLLERPGGPMRLRGTDMRGARIIMAAFPGCHFADNALKDIEKEPRLREVFEAYGLPLTKRADFESIGRWNGKHSLKYRLAAGTADWPEIDFSLSPTFYFMRDGATVYSFNGWSTDGFLDNVYRGLGYLFYGGAWRGDKEKEKQSSSKATPRRAGPLGNFLKGLSLDQKHGFCSGMSYAGGVFAGAPFEEIKATLGEAAAARLKTYITGPDGAAPRAGAEARAFGELLPGLGRKEMVRTCETMSFFDGRFGGLNFGDIWALPGERMTGEVMSFFSPPREKRSE